MEETILTQTKNKTLSVGSRIHNQGDINIDIKRYSNLDVVCDGFHLPFKNKSFNVVFCSHVLEHVFNPVAFIEEFKRVAINYVVIKVPNSVYYRMFQLSDEHIYGWNIFELENFLKRLFPSVTVQGNMRLTDRNKIKTIKTYILSAFLREPNELTAVCKVSG